MHASTPHMNSPSPVTKPKNRYDWNLVELRSNRPIATRKLPFNRGDWLLKQTILLSVRCFHIFSCLIACHRFACIRSESITAIHASVVRSFPFDQSRQTVSTRQITVFFHSWLLYRFSWPSCGNRRPAAGENLCSRSMMDGVKVE